LGAAGIKHQVLNARHHEQEANIIARAGVPGTVTVATNMAGRGTDIQLGGNYEMILEQTVAEEEEKKGRTLTEGELEIIASQIKADIAVRKKQALDAGGLYVLGTERHESRRIDNQLRGRTGRQGDPGKSKFYISTEDDLMRIFAADRMETVMRRLGIKEDEGITHPWMTKALQTSQGKIEQRNFEMRKNVLKYDDVINNQRKEIFEQRREFMHADDVSDVIANMRHDVVEDLVLRHMPEKAYAEQWDIEGLTTALQEQFSVDLPVAQWSSEEGVANEEIREKIIAAVELAYEAKTKEVNEASNPQNDPALGNRMHMIERQVLLRFIDRNWREHLQQIDQLRSVIGLRGYGQRDPLNEFKTEAFALFDTMLNTLRKDVSQLLMRVRVEAPPPPPPPPPQMVETHIDPNTGENLAAPQSGAVQVQGKGKIMQGRTPPRNAPCPCGSGKKYKHCHGVL
jgi:preprotein translocase subunit SecA